MTTRSTCAALALGLFASSAALAADPKFKKITLSNEFFSEGASAGDFNKDGKLDFVAVASAAFQGCAQPLPGAAR